MFQASLSVPAAGDASSRKSVGFKVSLMLMLMLMLLQLL